jgi:flavodoxin
MHDGMFYGLALDGDNEPEKTEERAKKWVGQLKKEMGI